MSSKPSNFLQRPSNVVVQRQHKKNTMVWPDHDNKLTRELSNLSIEAYHVDSASVPFVWESQPGTPKVRCSEYSLPPLTPPPSYFQNSTKRNPSKAENKSSPKSSFLQTLFPKLASRKGGVPPQTGSQNIWSYSSSSSSSSSSLPVSSPRPTSCSVPSSPMIYSRKGVEVEDPYEVTSSRLCFGNEARSRGCYSSMFKKVLLGDFL